MPPCRGRIQSTLRPSCLAHIGLWSAVALFAVLLLGSCSSDVERPQNLLLIVIDTLRADNLGCYGYPRDTSPAIDTLATRGVLFERAYSTASYTRAAIASLLTGHHPAVHKAVTHHDSMSPEVPTLPEILGEEGYSRVGFYLNENAGTWLGFDRGFERYDNPERHFRTTVNGEERDFFEPTGDRTVTDQAVPFLEEIGGIQTLFSLLAFHWAPRSLQPSDGLQVFSGEPACS